ncbi:MAG TPA: feruloyl-CoA synthase [Burkholderiaceae bacterium]|nr:feruloyl-CoA synthase [Burkholderiaceae bacterium]
MNARYRPVRLGGCLDAELQRRADGTLLLRSREPLEPFPDRLTDRLEHWAEAAPERTFVARRDHGGEWIPISYRQMLARAQRIGQALIERGLSRERPVAILSDNDLEHLMLAFGAMWVGVPYVPISPAYSLISQDHAKLRLILERTTPGLVFAAGPAYGRAIAAAVGRDVEVVLAEGTLPERATTPFARLLDPGAGAAAERAHAGTGPDTIAKFLFTSGSTKAPKGVVNTHRMLCANQQMLRQTLAFVADEPPVLVDWLPWNHTFGGNHNVGLTLYNGGTLYIDDGKPTPAGMAETLRNLREISPTIYFNVPKGFEEIAAAMESDETLRSRLFARVKLFMFAGAGLSQAVWDQLDRLGERTVGERIAMITGLGMTETAPTCTFAVRVGEIGAGHIGLPVPGVDVKLVPDGAAAYGKTEVRFRGPNVMPGYWRQPEQTAEVFDDEGFYRTGDAVRWVDPADPLRGLVFDGRLAEDFKLSTGTFVSVGPLRMKVIARGAPCIQDVVIAGLNRSEVAALVFPRLAECAALAGLPASAAANEVLAHPAVTAFFQQVLDDLWAGGTGSASRIMRMKLLAEPPSIDRGEVTDKGSINQRAVLSHRAAVVDALYEAQAGGGVLMPRRPGV